MLNEFFLSLRGVILYTAAVAIVSAGVLTARADRYWRAAGQTWGSDNNWSSDAANTSTPPVSQPVATDLIYFNVTPNNAVNTEARLNGSRTVLGVVVDSTANVDLRHNSGDGNSTLRLGTNGILMSGTTGRVTIGHSNGTNNVHVRLDADQTWTNNKTSTSTGTTGITVRGDVFPLPGGGDRTLTLSGTNPNSAISAEGGKIRDDGSNKLFIVKTGSGTWTLTNGTSAALLQHTFSGGVTINEGTIDINNGSSTLTSEVLTSGPLGVGDLTMNGGTLKAGNAASNNQVDNGISLNAVAENRKIDRTSSGVTTFNGLIQGAGGFEKTGSGGITFTAANTFSGPTTVSTGTLMLSNEFALQNSTISNISGGLLFDSAVVANAFTLGGLDGLGDIILQNDASTPIAFSVGKNDASTFHSGSLSGGGSLTKIGEGVTTLWGANSYSGTTLVANGTLSVNGSHIGGDNYTVGDGGTLGGTGLLDADVLVEAGGTINAGGGTGSLIVGNTNINGTFLVEFDADFDTIDFLSVNGALNIANATLDFVNLTAEALGGGPHVFAQYTSLPVAAFFDVQNLPMGFEIDFDYEGNKIALVPEAAGLPGDYNGDGFVDAADYVLWRKGVQPLPFNETVTPGITDEQDYIEWRTHFGNFAGSGTSLADTAVVPESSSIVLVLVSVLGLGPYRRRAGIGQH